MIVFQIFAEFPPEKKHCLPWKTMVFRKFCRYLNCLNKIKY